MLNSLGRTGGVRKFSGAILRHFDTGRRRTGREHALGPVRRRSWHAAPVSRRGMLAFAFVVAACGGDRPLATEVVGPRNLRPLERMGDLVVQRTVYVPIYSSLHVSDHAEPVDLGATLSLRNVSETVPVVVTAVDYYDSDGNLVRGFLDAPAELGPLATAEFFVARIDRSGGSGANFLVRWGLERPGPDLLVEAVMHGRDGAAGISFVSQGRVVQ